MLYNSKIRGDLKALKFCDKHLFLQDRFCFRLFFHAAVLGEMLDVGHRSEKEKQGVKGIKLN